LKFSPLCLHNRHQLSYRQIDAVTSSNHNHLYAEDVVSNMRLIRELLMIIEELKMDNVQFALLKGPALSQRIYNDSSVRICHDIDLFIPFHQIVLVFELLSKRGYLTEKEFSQNEENLLFLFYHNKDLKFFHPEKKVVVEVHWRLFTYDLVSKTDDPSFFDSYTEESQVEGKLVFVLKREFELLYILMHGATHKWVMLKWMLDVSDFLKNVPFSEEEFSQLVKIHKAQRVMALYNILASKYLVHPTLFQVKERVPSFLVRACVSEIERNVLPKDGFARLVGRSLKKLRFQFLLIPHSGRRKFLIKKYIKRDLHSAKVKKLVQQKLIQK